MSKLNILTGNGAIYASYDSLKNGRVLICPENNTHPVEQVKNAYRLIQRIDKHDKSYFVITYSPYYAQALRKYAELKDDSLSFEKRAEPIQINWYLYKKDFNKIQQTDGDSFMSNLAEPFQKLVWR